MVLSARTLATASLDRKAKRRWTLKIILYLLIWDSCLIIKQKLCKRCYQEYRFPFFLLAVSEIGGSQFMILKPLDSTEGSPKPQKKCG